MFEAVEVIKDKFWIIKHQDAKIGTLKLVENGYEFYNKNENKTELLKSIDNFILQYNEKKSVTFALVFGYPTNTDVAYEIETQDNVPIFKKNANSDIYFAAGYYGLCFPKGWQPSFCPKLKTLSTYTHIGPFKNEQDMLLAIKRKVQDNEGTNN